MPDSRADNPSQVLTGTTLEQAAGYAKKEKDEITNPTTSGILSPLRLSQVVFYKAVTPMSEQEQFTYVRNGDLNRKLRMALVVRGAGSFIGRVHCTAAVLDNRAALVAGALSSNPERAKASATAYDIGESRAYGSYQELLQTEAALPEDERIDFVSVAT